MSVRADTATTCLNADCFPTVHHCLVIDLLSRLKAPAGNGRGCVKTRSSRGRAQSRPPRSAQDRRSASREGFDDPGNCSSTEFSHSLGRNLLTTVLGRVADRRRAAVCVLRGLTLELTGPMRQDGLARAVKMYRVPQAGPRRPAVADPVVQRGARPHCR